MSDAEAGMPSAIARYSPRRSPIAASIVLCAAPTSWRARARKTWRRASFMRPGSVAERAAGVALDARLVGLHETAIALRPTGAQHLQARVRRPPAGHGHRAGRRPRP